MESQRAQLKVVHHQSAKMATSILFQGLQFLCERENSVCWRFVLLRTGLQQIYLQTNSGGL